MRRLGLALLGLGLFGLGCAFGQAGGQLLTSLGGTEQVTVQAFQPNGQPSPLINTVTVNTIRNTTGYQLSSATSGTVNATVATDNLIFTAAAGTVGVNMPPSPPDGQLFSVNNGTGSAFSGTITVSTTDSSTISNGSTAVNLAAAAGQEWQYVKSTTTWYRLR